MSGHSPRLGLGSGVQCCARGGSNGPERGLGTEQSEGQQGDSQLNGREQSKRHPKPEAQQLELLPVLWTPG